MNPSVANNNDTIVALATPAGVGAIAVVRLSGYNAIKITDKIFKKKGKNPKSMLQQRSHTLHFGYVSDGDQLLDEVLVGLFFAPHSYTGENIVEISCHGSRFIQQQLIQLIIKNGARLANPGEFTLRAFLNGKIDLSQAEAVADIIASNSNTSHQIAMLQMRGGFSSKIKMLRENLVNFASLIELELDFSEEDVEFANRDDLKKLILSILNIVTRLIHSFELGNVIKNGIPVVIIGKPNAGKSTLLNTLVNEERAIVSEIPGTTRDIIEDEITIGGVLFRFIDTAGIRETSDAIELIGVNKAFEKMKSSSVILYLFDVNEVSRKELEIKVAEIKERSANAQIMLVGNKIDTDTSNYIKREFEGMDDIIFISAKNRDNINILEQRLLAVFDNSTANVPETVVTNARHVEALENTRISLEKILEGLHANIETDLLSHDIKNALYNLGLITGQVTNDDILGNIFERFCIGK